MSELSPPPTRTSFVDGLPPGAVNAAIFGGVILIALLLGWIGRGFLTGPGDVAMITMHEDWRLTCPARKEKDVSCRITQDVVSKEGQPLASLVFLKEKGKDKKETTVLAVNVPLNVLLEPGLGLKFGNETKTYQYRTCLQAGCVAIVPVDDKLIDSLGEASDASVTVYRLDSKAIDIPFSTKGFVQARKAYKNSEAKRSNLWWRLWI